MAVEPVDGPEGITLFDTEMFGESSFTAAFLFRSEKSLLVDAGLYEDGRTVEQDLISLGLSPQDLDYLAISHLHLDHAGGATYLASQYSSFDVLCHPITAEYLTDTEKLQSLFASGQSVMSSYESSYGQADPLDPKRIKTVSDGQEIDLGDRSLTVLEATGHAPHQICFFDGENQALFLADEGCARMDGRNYPTTPPPDFDYDKTDRSLRRFIELDPEYLLYSHFGYCSEGTETLKSHRTILSDWVNFIRELREGESSREEIINRVLEVFGEEVNGALREIIKRDTRGVLTYLDSEETQEHDGE